VDRPGPGWLLLGGCAMLVTGCTMNQPPPTSTPAVPTMVIVTATPGVPDSATAPRSVNQRYVVREGDSLSSIAERFDVTEAAIMRANNLADPDRILVGQELVIPPPEP
jgi:LysM repeat protein